MGSDLERDPLALAEEFPQHVVSLPAYEIGRCPVTVAEYAYALSAVAASVQAPVNWEQQREFLTYPVSGLTWYDAVAYARWLTEQAREHWRLPTEAEWEKAARGTDGRIYPWGDTWDPEKAHALIPGARGNQQSTSPVDQYPLGVSPYGAFDLVGNVGEWTSTIHDPQRFAYPYRDDDGREDLTEEEGFRVIRGGCWLYPPEKLGVARRGSFHTSDRFDWLHGMRLVRDTISL